MLVGGYVSTAVLSSAIGAAALIAWAGRGASARLAIL